jgi:pSer/pThr/pTyr-binding forkhead associated (FHA) protein
MSGKTRKLDKSSALEVVADPQIKTIDFGMPRPWRIALRLAHLQMQLVFDLSGSLLVGRANPDTGFFPDLDLGPFNGGEMGVSREHLFFKLDGDRVVIVDNHSANGTQLNNEWLKPDQAYPLRHGDELMLGLLKVQVELLTNPFY